MFRPARILVPTDLSDDSDVAIRRAFDVAKTYGSEVHVLHVIIDPVKQCIAEYCLSDEITAEINSRMLETVRSQVWGQLTKFASMGVIPVHVDIRTGVPHDEILNAAEEWAADLIVIATFGKTGMGKYLMGSVARHVLSGAKCSVMLVK